MGDSLQRLQTSVTDWWTPHWSDMRGNAKFIVVVSIFNAIAAAIGRLTLGPHWQMWAFISIAACCALIWICFPKQWATLWPPISWFSVFLTCTILCVVLPKQPTPIRDDAMRLVMALGEFVRDAGAKKWPQDQVIERFGKNNYDQWAVRVHRELFEHNRHNDRFDEIAQKLETVGVFNAFMGIYNKPATNTIAEIMDDIKTLAEPLKE